MIHLFRETIDSSGVFLAQVASLLLEGHWTGGCFPCFNGRQNFRRCCRIVFCLPLAHPDLSFGYAMPSLGVPAMAATYCLA